MNSQTDIPDSDALWELLRTDGHLVGLRAAVRTAENTIFVLVPGRDKEVLLAKTPNPSSQRPPNIFLCVCSPHDPIVPVLPKRFSILACLVFIQDPTHNCKTTPALWVLQTAVQFQWQTVNHHVLLALVTLTWWQTGTQIPLKYRLSLDHRNNLWTLHQVLTRPARLISLMWWIGQGGQATTKEQAQAQAEQLIADMLASQHPDKIILPTTTPTP